MYDYRERVCMTVLSRLQTEGERDTDCAAAGVNCVFTGAAPDTHTSGERVSKREREREGGRETWKKRRDSRWVRWKIRKGGRNEKDGASRRERGTRVGRRQANNEEWGCWRSNTERVMDVVRRYSEAIVRWGVRLIL